MTPIPIRAAYQLGYRRGHPALVGNWDWPPSQIGISQVQMGRRERVGKRDTGTGATSLVQACVEVLAVLDRGTQHPLGLPQPPLDTGSITN